MSLNYTVRYCAITVSDVISFMDWMPFYKVKEFRSAAAAEESNRIVVLYEEGLDPETIQGAVQAIASADTLIIGGGMSYTFSKAHGYDKPLYRARLMAGALYLVEKERPCGRDSFHFH